MAGNPQHWMMMARDQAIRRHESVTVGYCPAGDEQVALKQRRRGHGVKPFFPGHPGEAAIVVPLDQHQPHVPLAQPTRQPGKVRGGSAHGLRDSTRSPATTRRSIGDRSSNRSSFLSVSARELRRHAVARRAAGPLVAKVDVGNHGDSLARVDRTSFGGKPPTLDDGGCARDRQKPVAASCDLSRSGRGQPRVQPAEGVGRCFKLDRLIGRGADPGRGKG